jgi:hypothetical protein
MKSTCLTAPTHAFPLLFAAALASSASGDCAAATTVTVELRDVAVGVARDFGVQPARLPTSVELPIEAAATACDVAVASLRRAASDARARCRATSYSSDLREAVRRTLDRSETGLRTGYPPGAEADWVRVDIAPVVDEIARLLGVGAHQVPWTVRAPAAVASDACQIRRDVLVEQQALGNAACTALTATPALNAIVRPQLALQPRRSDTR